MFSFKVVLNEKRWKNIKKRCKESITVQKIFSMYVFVISKHIY